jgi:hypothetical protein
MGDISSTVASVLLREGWDRGEARHHRDQYYVEHCADLAREVQRLTAERDGMADLLRDLSCDGCEYGDNCPPNAGTRHGQCIPCKCREELERLATQKEPTT